MKRINLENGYVIDINKTNNSITLKNSVEMKLDSQDKKYEQYNVVGYYRDLGSCIYDYNKNVCMDRLKFENSIEEAIEIFKEVKNETKKLTEKLGI